MNSLTKVTDGRHQCNLPYKSSEYPKGEYGYAGDIYQCECGIYYQVKRESEYGRLIEWKKLSKSMVASMVKGKQITKKLKGRSNG
jgi:hypothetical protein